MLKEFPKCSACRHDYFPRQLTPVQLTDDSYDLCPDCYGDLAARISSRDFLGAVIKNTLPVGQRHSLRVERAVGSALKDFDMEAIPV